MPMNNMDPKECYPRESYLSICMWPSDTPEEREELASVVCHWAKAIETQQWPRALQYFQNYAFLVGQPYIQFQFDGSSVTTALPRGALRHAMLHIPKVVCNYIIRPFEANVSMFTEVKPFPQVSPRSDSPEDEDASKLSEVVLQVLWEDPLRMPEKLRLLAGMVLLTGTAAAEVTYSEGDSPLIKPKKETKVVDDEILGQIEVEEEVDEDDVTFLKEFNVNLYNAFQILPDPAATSDPDSLTWIMTCTYQDKGWVREHFNRDEEGFFPENLDKMTGGDTTSPLYWCERIKDLVDSPNETFAGLVGSATSGTGVSSTDVIMRVVDCKPNRCYPQGRTLIVAGGQLVYAGPSRAWSEKYPKRWTTLTMFRYWTMPDRFWGIPLLTELIPLQRRVNAIDSLVQLDRQQLALGGWLLPNTARIPDGFIGSVPGQNVPYHVSHTGAKPERIPNEPLPQQLLIERETMVAAIQEISGMNQIMMGNTPANVRSGAMLDFLKRQALQSKSAIFQNFEEGLERLAQNILIEVATNLEEEDSDLTQRIQVAAREHSGLAIQAFTGADLRDNTVVELDISSKMMTSPEAKQETAQSILQYYGQNVTPIQFNRIAAAMGIEEFAREENLHVTRARRMISLIKAGHLEAGLTIPGVDNPAIFAEVFRAE